MFPDFNSKYYNLLFEPPTSRGFALVMEPVTCFASPVLPPTQVRSARAVCSFRIRMSGGIESADDNASNDDHSSGVVESPNEPPTLPKGPPKSNASWSKTGLDGFEHKGTGSHIGWDLRPSSLRTPEEGSGTCDLCRGTGETLCSFCFGEDYIGPNGRNVQCNACKGKHILKCSVCYGSGKQIDIEGNWFTRNFSKLLRRD